MRRLLVNDCLTCIPGTRTFWSDLQEWFGMEFFGGDYATLAYETDRSFNYALDTTQPKDFPAFLSIIRNASYFGPLKASNYINTISILQDIFTEGPARAMQEAVIASSRAVVFNSAYTASKYDVKIGGPEFKNYIIPLPVDFSIFEPGNTMGLQQALGLPDGCICWVGACQGAAGHVKGWDIFIQIARTNPDLHFVAVLKDAMPESFPPNVRCYVRLPQDELAKVMGACRVGLCTSRMESQHLAGIEMGACGLPVVAPPVGVYWHRNDLPGMVYGEGASVPEISGALRGALSRPAGQQFIRDYWCREFDRPVIKAAWTALVEEVEFGNAFVRMGAGI